MDLMIFRSHHINNNNNDEKRTLNALIKRTRIWTYRWIYERFVSYEPLCFKRVIFVQNERKEKNWFFFFEKDLRFLFVSSLGATVLARSRLLEEKKMKATPLILGGLESSSSPRLFWLFCRRKFVVSLAQKGAKKRVCGCFVFCIERERAAQE